MNIPIIEGGSVLHGSILVTKYGDYKTKEKANEVASKIEGGLVRKNNRTLLYTVFYPTPQTDLSNIK